MNMKLVSNIEKKRLTEIKEFLESENIPLTSLVKIKGDASFRVYYRIKNTDYILMDANPKTNEKISSFIKIQKILSEYGINVPKIYKKNVSLGLMIIQDLGKKKFLDYVNDSTSKKNLYTSCKSVLIKIHSRSIERPSKIKNIKKYTMNEQMKETDLFFSWYLKKHLKKTISKKEKDSFKRIFGKIYKNLKIKNYCLVLRDFHVDNIIPMPLMGTLNKEKMPISSKAHKLGLIDFQDALVGSPAYDFCSLIEDVRAPLDKLEKEIAISKYLIKSKALLNNNANQTLYNFKTQVSYFSIQRNLKILGIFSRLKYRDEKSKYIKYLPQAKRFIKENLKKHEFRELRNWFTENKINV